MVPMDAGQIDKEFTGTNMTESPSAARTASLLGNCFAATDGGRCAVERYVNRIVDHPHAAIAHCELPTRRMLAEKRIIVRPIARCPDKKAAALAVLIVQGNGARRVRVIKPPP